MASHLPRYGRMHRRSGEEVPQHLLQVCREDAGSRADGDGRPNGFRLL